MTDPRSTDVVPTLPQRAAVVNVGLALFADAVAAQGHPLAVVDWRIPAGGDTELVACLGRLYGRRSAAIDAANAEVLRRLDEATPQLVEVAPARDVVPGLGERMLLHCGPPIAYGDACDPLRRSLRAAVVAEGWARGVDEADRLLAGGEVLLDAANAHDTVVPMVTALGPSQPVWVADNPAGGNRAFAPLNQGPGETPWFGRETPAAIERLRFLSAGVGPVMADALRQHGPIDVLGLAAQGVQMGDDVHIRVQASTNLFLRTMLPYLVATSHPARVEVARFLSANHLFFLTAAMAGARALTGWAGGGAGLVDRDHDGPQRQHARHQAGRVGGVAPHRRARRSAMPSTTPGRDRRRVPATSVTARCWSSSAWAVPRRPARRRWRPSWGGR